MAIIEDKGPISPGDMLVTPTGSTPARTLADVAAAARTVIARPWKLLHKTPSVSVIAAPGTILIDEIVDLARWGLTLDQYLLQIDAVFTKAVGGAQVVTGYSADSTEPGRPAAEPGVPGIGIWARALMDAGGQPALPGYPDPLTSTEAAYSGIWGIEAGGHDYRNKCRFVRLLAWRAADYAYSPAEEAQFAGHELHINVTGPDVIVKAWDVPILAAQGAVLTDFTIDLRDYGLTSDKGETRLIAMFLRGGEIIHSIDTGVTAAEPGWATYLGEVFDPPTYPVTMRFRGMVDGEASDYEWEPNNGEASLSRYGDEANPDAWCHGDVLVFDDPANCTGDVRSLVRIKAWRPPTDGPVDYVAVRGEAAVAIPAGAKDDCILRLMLCSAAPTQRGIYPFRYSITTPDLWEQKARVNALYGPDSGAAPTFDSGVIVGTGVEQEVPHVLVAIPGTVRVNPLDGGTEASLDTSPRTATAFYVAIELGKKYLWIASRV